MTCSPNVYSFQETVRASDDILLSDHRKWGWPHVFVRCLQNMLGVIIFIRIAWITGEVGLGESLDQIASMIALITAYHYRFYYSVFFV